MAEHEHGTMNYDEQEKMFAKFMNFVSRTTIAILVLLVLMLIFIR